LPAIMLTTLVSYTTLMGTIGPYSTPFNN